MFKKGYRVSNTANLKKSDIRRFRERFLRERQDLEFSQAESDALFPKTMVQAKLSNSRASVYLDGAGVPLFLDLGLQRSKLVPTIFNLWMVPETIVTITMDEGVLAPLLRGADFMAAGLKSHYALESLPHFALGDPIALQLSNGRCVAVGTAKLSSGRLMRDGLHGKLVEIHQVLGDHLFVNAWETSPSPRCSLPEDLAHLQPALGLPPRAEVCEEETDELRDVLEEANKEVSTAPEDAEAAEEESAAAAEAAAEEEQAKEAAKAKDIAEAVQRQEAKVSMDDLLRMSFMQALRVSVDPEELPMPASSFYSMHVLPSRPRDTILDIKKTSWKKLTKFLKQMEKEKFVTTKTPPKGDMQVYSANTQHPKVLAFDVYKRMAATNQTGTATKEETEESEREQEQSEKGFSLTTVYQAGKIFDLFKAVRPEAARADLYSAKEAAALLWKYVDEQGLTVEGRKQCVSVSDLLLPAVRSLQLKAGDECEKKALARAFADTLTKFTLVCRDGSTQLHKGAPQPVAVKEERRGGNKYVTGVQGLEYYTVKPEAAAKKLRAVFAASTTVNEVPMGKSKPARSEVIIQGKVGARTADALEEHFGIPKQHISVALGKAKPSKKRR